MKKNHPDKKWQVDVWCMDQLGGNAAQQTIHTSCKQPWETLNKARAGLQFWETAVDMKQSRQGGQSSSKQVWESCLDYSASVHL